MDAKKDICTYVQKIFDLIEYIMQILYGSLIWRPANFLLLSGPASLLHSLVAIEVSFQMGH